MGNLCHACVEVMNIDNKQWFTGPPTPTPWRCMKTATVSDVWYFMGGYTTYKHGIQCVFHNWAELKRCYKRDKYGMRYQDYRLLSPLHFPSVGPCLQLVGARDKEHMGLGSGRRLRTCQHHQDVAAHVQ